MPRADCFVSVVAPLRDDADIVGDFIQEVVGVVKDAYANYEIVLVDDGSTDDTVEVVSSALREHECLRLIRLSRAFGRETALSAGLDSVIGDFIVTMLPDRDPPALIPDMVEQCRRGRGIVFGVRADRRGDPAYLRAGSALFYWYCNRILKMNLPRNSTDFRVLSRQALNALIRIKDRFRYLRSFCTYVGYGSDGYTYQFAHRRSPPRRRRLSEAIGTAVNMIVANSTQPLRAVSLIGVGLGALSLAYIVYVLVVRLVGDNVVPGWATLSLQTSALFLFVFLILSVLCEYVGRVLVEVRNRPLYYVLEERSSSVMIADETRRNVVTEEEMRE
jgi:dolichol-phosphate mannosyltransferase